MYSTGIDWGGKHEGTSANKVASLFDGVFKPCFQMRMKEQINYHNPLLCNRPCAKISLGACGEIGTAECCHTARFGLAGGGGDTPSEVYVDIAGDDTEDFGIAAHDIPISPGG